MAALPTASWASYQRQAKTYAKMFALTRADIINDDLGAFDDLRKRLGRGAATKFNDVFWPKFMNNAAFFTADRGNYITGATTNLGLDATGLELGVTAFRKLRSATADGAKRVSGRPEVLLIPPELEFIASRIFAAVNTNTGGAATATSVPDKNIHAAERLDDSGVQRDGLVSAPKSRVRRGDCHLIAQRYCSPNRRIGRR